MYCFPFVSKRASHTLISISCAVLNWSYFVVSNCAPGGGGVFPKKLGRGVRPASQNPCPIYHQNLRYSLPCL